MMTSTPPAAPPAAPAMTATSLLDACGLSGGGDEGGGERETVSGWEIAEIVTPETPAALSADPRAAGLAKMHPRSEWRRCWMRRRREVRWWT